MPQAPYPTRLSHLVSMALFLLLQACATPSNVPLLEYDFAPLSQVYNATTIKTAQAKAATAKLTISLAEINAPATLDSDAMMYRLAYSNPQSLRPYAHHHWSMSPAKLLTQRLKARIAANGLNVVMPGDGVNSAFTLRIDLDEFDQVFASPTQSQAQISLRASIIKGRNLLAQRSFSQQISAASADAAGGAKALQDAADAVIAALLQWLQEVPSP